MAAQWLSAASATATEVATEEVMATVTEEATEVVSIDHLLHSSTDLTIINGDRFAHEVFEIDIVIKSFWGYLTEVIC